MTTLRTIAVYGSRRQHNHTATLRRLFAALAMDGVAIAMHHRLYDHLTADLAMTLPGVERVFDCPAGVDMALSIGGDGTLLRAVHWVESVGAPVLGLNTGHLGYLTAVSLDGTGNIADAVLSRQFHPETLAMLSVTTPDGNVMTALNDVVVTKDDTTSVITASVTVDTTPLADYRADGLIVATPTGSTAYNLSAGGPIVAPSAAVTVLTPIAAHSLALRPLVVPDTTTLTICVTGRGTRFRLSVDGRTTSLPMGTTITVSRADRNATILRLPHHHFANVLDEKLGFHA